MDAGGGSSLGFSKLLKQAICLRSVWREIERGWQKEDEKSFKAAECGPFRRLLVRSLTQQSKSTDTEPAVRRVLYTLLGARDVTKAVRSEASPPRDV